MTDTSRPVPPKSLEAAIAHVRAGGRLFVASMTRCIVIDARCLARFERAGVPVIKESGDGYRIASGRKYVYVIPGALRFEAL